MTELLLKPNQSRSQPLPATDAVVSVVGKWRYRDFLSMLTNEYLDQLSQSQESHDQDLLQRFTPKKIEHSVIGFIKYTQEKEEQS